MNEREFATRLSTPASFVVAGCEYSFEQDAFEAARRILESVPRVEIARDGELFATCVRGKHGSMEIL